MSASAPSQIRKDKLVILYATIDDPNCSDRFQVVAMGRYEQEYTENLLEWLLGATEDQLVVDAFRALPVGDRSTAIQSYLAGQEIELYRDAYTLGAS